MSRNPIVPFILIFALGIGLIFFMSLYGIEQKEEITQEANGETEEVENVAEVDIAQVAQGKCVSCHGGNLEGGGAPALAGTALSHDELVEIIKDGIPPAMPGGLIPDDQLDEMADYILSLE